VAEEEGGQAGGVILTDSVWRSRFGHDPTVVGRTVILNGESRVVIGITPPNLHLPDGVQWGPFVGPPVQPLIFLPLNRNVANEPPSGNLNYSAVVRLKKGVTAAPAAVELNGLVNEFVRQFHISTTVSLIPLSSEVVRKDRGALLLLLGAVVMVLLIACLNIGNLMLVRSAGRHREASLRLALGASRFRIFSLVLFEAILLVLTGGIAGVGLAYAGLKLFVTNAPITIARLDEVGMDWRGLAFAAASTAAAAILCGLAPAWRLAHTTPQASLKSAGGNTSGAPSKLWFQKTVVALQAAFSTLLLITGSLLMLSFFNLLGVDKGFDTTRVITQDISFQSPKYMAAERLGFLDETISSLVRLPGMQAVGAVNRLPLLGEQWVSTLKDPDQPVTSAQEDLTANFWMSGIVTAYLP
jgi:predicted permease